MPTCLVSMLAFAVLVVVMMMVVGLGLLSVVVVVVMMMMVTMSSLVLLHKLVRIHSFRSIVSQSLDRRRRVAQYLRLVVHLVHLNTTCTTFGHFASVRIR